MWFYPIVISCIILIAVLAYLFGKKQASTTTTESKTTTFLIKSIQAIAELEALREVQRGQ